LGLLGGALDDALWAVLLPLAAGGFFAPFDADDDADAVPLLSVAVGFEFGFGLRVDGWVEAWLCEDVPPADIGAGLIGTGFIGAVLAACGGFAGAVVVSGAVVVASSNAANGWESASGAGAGAGDHCDCANNAVELTSDAILDTA
jgi:hypothetical protein